MNKIDSIETNFLSRQYLGGANAILIYLAFSKFLIHLLTSTGYGYFGDELYYLDATKHLDFGYVDMPPFVPFLMAISNRIFGVSLFGLHILPAVAGAVMVFFSGLLARELGGGRFAQSLTALAVMTAPFWLMVDSWFAYDPFDQLMTVIVFYLIALLLKQETPRRWIVLGIIAGVGIMTKLSMLFIGFALVAALLLTTRRRWLISKWPLLAVLVMVVISTPFLVWQATHAWPLFKYWHHYAVGRPHAGPLQSFKDQVFLTNSAALIIWIPGLYYLLLHREGKKYRVLGLMYLVLLILFVGVMRFEARMMVSAYFPLLAGGAVFLESAVAHLTARHIIWTWLKPVLAGIILLSGLRFAPVALPVLPPPEMARYAFQQLGMAVPPNFMLRFGWPEMVQKVAVVYRNLPETDRRKCVIYTGMYFEAGAVNFFGKKYGLPEAVCNHLSYQIWGLGKYDGEVAIAFGYSTDPSVLAEMYDEVETTNVIIESQYGPLTEQYLSIFVCRKPKVPLKEAWSRMAEYL